MARKPRAFAIAGAATALAIVAGIGWVGWDSTRPRLEAPKEAMTCWRMTLREGRAGFAPLSRRTENLESCAATLEVIWLESRRPVQGAYQGRFIFVGPEAVESAESLEGARWRIFWGAQRERIDKRILLARQRQSQGLPTLPGLPELPN